MLLLGEGFQVRQIWRAQRQQTSLALLRTVPEEEMGRSDERFQ
jgi:hypothetical protein